MKAVLSIILTILIMYGTYWVTKNVSYFIFYEGMVQQTITEMVKQEALR